MKNQATETAKQDFVKSVLDRRSALVIRPCVLNVIPQIALGAPMAAQAKGNFHPALK